MNVRRNDIKGKIMQRNEDELKFQFYQINFLASWFLVSLELSY
jgi:hypothetical protein